jgi:2-polyprenyl-6-methoxyphenol hydroxylase-like FAD-dependent oxidoreductase
MHGTNFYSDAKRIVHVGFEDNDTPYPFALCLPQSDTEKLLTEHLSGYGVEVERRVKLRALEQDDTGVTATLAREGEGESRARFAWVVGCDGAHSTTRELLGIAFDGVKYEENFALADVAVDGPLPDDEMHAFLSAEGVIAFLPLPGDGRWRVVADAGENADPTFEWVCEIARARTSVPITLRDPRWVSSFRIHRRIAASYRKGRVFLAGDAAHIHSPMGGQGMNTGIQDAVNLAWKLALVGEGKGAPALIDTYETERRPIGAVTLENTDFLQRVVTIRNPIAREVRNHLMALLTSVEAVQRRLARTTSMITLGYRKSPIVSEDRLAIIHANVTVDRGTEDPTLGDWLDFGAAAAAGDRAPDCAFGDEAAPAHLFDLFRHPAQASPKHTLLLFDGAAATAEGYANLASIARRVRDAHGSHVDVHVVVPRPTKPKGLDWDGSVLLDTNGALHNRYGAGSECLYVIRPDGYVGYRAQPAEAGRLVAHFARVFR